jgi:hypothetical protein
MKKIYDSWTEMTPARKSQRSGDQGRAMSVKSVGLHSKTPSPKTKRKKEEEEK